MWGNEENGPQFVFPPLPFHPKLQDTETSSNIRHHHFRGRGGSRGHHQQNANGYQRDNRLGKGNQQFYCDTCDRAFEDGSLLAEHSVQHKTCGWDGCTFRAHFKIVELHVKMQHETGFADKIMQLNSPEEIEKWKNERRRNYPTADNIARRQAEQAKRAERGELIPSKEFGKFNRNGNRNFDRIDSTRGRGGHRTNVSSGRTMDWSANAGSGGQSRRKRRKANHKNNDATNNVLPVDSDDFFGFKRFAGIGTAAAEVGQNGGFHEENLICDLITDSEGETTAPTEEAIVRSPNVPIPKALENLVAAYSSESEEETNANARTVETTMPNVDTTKHQCQNRSMATSRPFVQPRKKFTLLEMLLAKEIQLERNKIFQCVRHIVESEFFGIR